MPTYSTASTVLTQARGETSVGATPVSSALQDTAMLRELNDLNSWFINYPYSVGMLGWKFMHGETIFQTKANTTLNGALSSGATSIVLTSGTDFDSPSSDVAGGYIKTSTNIYDYFTYESRSSATLSTVAGIQYAHPTASEVHKVYRLPSDFGKPRGLFRQSNVYSYQYINEDQRQNPPYGYYMIKTLVGTNYTGDFLVFPVSVGAVDWKFVYLKAPTTISATTTNVDFPDGNPRRAVVEKLKGYIWMVLGEYDLANVCEQKAAEFMEKSLSEHSTHTVQPNQSLLLMW